MGIVTVPLSEYIENVYHPDCEYIDGELRERNAGELAGVYWEKEG